MLASAALHAGWNALLKRAPRPEAAAPGVLAVATLASAALVPLIRGEGALLPGRAALLWGLCAGAFEAVYFLCLARALRRAPLGLAYTVSRGGALLVVWPVSVLLLGERLTGPGALGALLVGAGVAAVGLERPAPGAGRGAAWAAGSAACIAGYHFAYQRALHAGGDAGALVAVSLAVAVPANLLAMGAGARADLLAQLRAPRPLALLVTAGVVCAVSFLLFLGALRTSGAGAVLTLRNTSVLFAQGFGWALGERPTPRRLAGAGLVVLGAALLAWP